MSDPTASTETWLPVGPAARWLGVHPNTLRAWSNQGLVRHARLPVSRQRRYPLTELRRVRREVMGYPDEAAKES